MSTILNALKKLEQEHKIYKTGDSPQLQQPFVNRRALAPASWRGRLGRFNIRWTWVAIALIGLAIGFMVAGPDSAPTQPAVSSSSESLARAERPDKAFRATVNPVPDSAPTRNERVLPVPPSRQPDPIAEKAPSTEPAPLETEIIETPPVKAARPPSETTRTDPPPSPVRKPEPQTSPPDPPASTAQKSVTTKVPDPKPATSKPNPRFAQAQHLTDGRLEVQAIAWSPVVEDRMAVINNQIIHQGDSVDGFSVVEIGEDKVLVKEGPQYYVVYFGSR